MYAIIQSGGRQVKVEPGSAVVVDHVDTAPGQEVTFDQVLFIRADDGTLVSGSPFVTNARVIGIIDGEVRGPKIRVFRIKRRKGMRRTRGHRSVLSRVQIKQIDVALAR